MNAALTTVLRETRDLLSRKGNDFSWSSWNDRQEAVAEIQTHLEQIERGDYSKLFDLEVLFAPTGPIQEASMSSGWAKEYLAVAERFDEEIKKLGAIRPSPNRVGGDIADPAPHTTWHAGPQ
jgi:hypothetical protein